MFRLSRTWTAALGSLLVALPVAGLAGAAPVNAAPPAPIGGPVTTLSTDGQEPAVLVDRAGTTTVVWASDWCRGPIYAARRLEGAEWDTPVQIGRGTAPQIAADAAGNVTVIFETNPANRTTGISAVRLPAGGSWQAPVRLSRDLPATAYNCNGDEGTFGAHRADLAVSPRGAAVVVWQWGSYDRDRPFRIQAAFRPAAGPWTAPAPLTRPNWSEDPHVGIDRAGNATAVYSPGGTGAIARRRVLGVGWQTPTRVSTRGWEFDVVVAPGGTATATFARSTSSRNTIHAVRRAPGGGWGVPIRISPARVYIWGSEAVVDAAGTVTVVWQRKSGRIDVVRRPAAGPWSAPIQVAPTDGGNDTPTVATNATGDVAVLWDNETGGLNARLRDRTEGWTPQFAVSLAVSYFPLYRAAVYPDGGMIGVWQTADDTIDVRQLPAR